VARALEECGHDVVRLEIGAGVDALDALAGAEMDVAFLALHGKQGEDGCIQGVLELLGIPYTGSGVLASALAMDKLKSKELFRLHNVPTPPYYAVNRSSAGELEELHGSFGFPVVVKPRREGSSVGVAKATTLAELEAAVDNALLYDDSVLVERFIKAREVAVAVLDGRVLGAIEIAPSGELYDFQAKYESDHTQYFLPARFGSTRLLGILNLAQRTADALDLRGAARVDLLVTEGMNEYVLEVNTLPGMTESSLLPKIAAAAGYDFSALCQAILETARLDSGLTMGNLRRLSVEQADPQIWDEAVFEEEAIVAAMVKSRHRATARGVRKSA